MVLVNHMSVPSDRVAERGVFARPGRPSPRIVAEAGHLHRPRDAVLVLTTALSTLQTDWRPSRWAAIQKAVRVYVSELAQHEPEARVDIVEYNDSATHRFGLVLSHGISQLDHFLEGISCRGGTCIASALHIAQTLLSRSRCPAQVILLVDDRDAWGLDPYPASDRIVQRAILDCVAIGANPGDVDEHVLREIASTDTRGEKRYQRVTTPSQLMSCMNALASSSDIALNR